MSSEIAVADFRVLADAMPQIVWTASADGAIDWYNARWYSYTGQIFEEAAGRGWQAVHHPDDLQEVMRRWPHSLETGEPFDMEFRLKDSDGAFRWFLTRVLPIRNAAGGIVKWVGTNTDIHERWVREEQLRFIDAASRALSQTLTLTDAIKALLYSIVPTQADWAAVYLVEESGRVSRMAERHEGLACELASALELLETTAPADRSAVATVLRSGRSRLERDVRCRAHDDVFSRIAVPFVVGGAAIGALVVYRALAERRYNNQDLSLFNDLAQRAALALTHARSFERERRVAAVLQEASLPRILPRVDHLHLDAIYRSGKNEATIGGDWYDAFQLPDGRVALTIGDVMGSGLRAAVTMTKLRQAMQSAALIQPDPNAMLAAADGTLRMHDSDGYATAIAAIFDPRTHMLIFASAGHPGPLLRTADGRIEEFSSPGTLLGMRPSDEKGIAEIALAPGSVLAFFIDGLVEATRDLIAGQQRIHAAMMRDEVATCPRPAEALADAVLGVTGAVDDVAILTATVLPAREETQRQIALVATARVA